MKEQRIKVLMVEPGKHPKETVLANDLDALQKAVSIGTDYQGYIEIIALEPGVCLLCNEEGKLNGMEGNRRVGRDIIAGVFYIVGDTENGDLASLPEDKMQKYMERFWEVEHYLADDVESALIMRFFSV